MTSSSPPSQPASSTSRNPSIALLLIVTCQLMVILDATIVNVALPEMQRALDFSEAGLSWVLNAYALAFGGLLLLGGRAGDILGRRRVFLAGVLVFTVASLIGGLANSDELLLVSRAAQGVGAAFAAPGTLALIATTFEEGPARTRAVGVYGAVSGSGAAIGLVLGGVLTDWLSWRWVMFVNVPFGLLLLLLVPVYIKETDRIRGSRFDITGALTSTVGMTLLVYGFIRAAEDGWSDGLALGSFAVAVVLLVWFLIWESRANQPILPLSLFADRDRSIMFAGMLLLSGTMTGMFFFLTQFVQKVLDFSPLKAGFAFVPVALALMIAAGVVTKQLAQVGAKTFMLVGVVLVGAGMAWLAQIDAGSSYLGGLLGPMLLFGVGVGFFTVPLTVVAVSGVPPHESGAASSALNAMQQVGGSLGLAVLVTVFTNAARDAAADAPAGLDPAGIANYSLAEGSSLAFWVGLGFSVAALLAVTLVRAGSAAPPAPVPAPAAGPESAGPESGGAESGTKGQGAVETH
ncbi:MFS transporter [Streptomyces tsukubensis]|uniref:MFS transporter n=1 Tax=Streptomyces tsukubensis TaxID=83656 RepID=UPI00344ED178